MTMRNIAFIAIALVLAIAATVLAFVVLYGVFLLFNVEYSYWGGTHWTGGMGLLFIFLGPILIRLSYELMMVVILLLKNVISINRKLADQTGAGGADVFLAPDMAKLREEARQQQAASQAAPPCAYCRVCGTQLVDGVCPKCPPQYCKLCGTQLVNGVCPKCPPQYCKLCGTQLVNGICPKCSAPTDSTPPQA